MSAKNVAPIILVCILIILFASKSELAANDPIGCVPHPENMVGRWPGNGNADDFLNVHNGNLGAQAGYVSGKIGEAFDLDGVNDYVTVTDSIQADQLDGLPELTIEAWVYPEVQTWQDGGNYINAIVSKYNTTLANGASYYLILYNGQLQVVVFQSVTPEVWAGLKSNNSLPVNQWSHVVGVWKGGTTFELYVNGVQVAGSLVSGGSPTQAMTMAQNDIPLNFGRVESFSNTSTGPSAFFNGQIDDVAIYSRALSFEEIQAIYLAGSAGKCGYKNYLPIITKPFFFTKTETSPFYLQNYTNHFGCNWMGTAGEVLDLNRDPVDYGLYAVHIWGSGIDNRAIVGGAPAYSPAGWEQYLNNTPVIRDYFLQLETVSGVPISPVYGIQTRAACNQNLVRLDFIQTQ